MKRLYEFSLYKTDTVKEKSESTNDKGEKVITEKDVEKKVEHKYLLRKPTRSMYDDAELFYGVKLAEGVKAGLLNHALLAKRYNNDGGIFTDAQQEDFANSYFELLNDQTDWQQLVIKGEDKSKSEETQQEDIERRMSLNRRKLQSYEADKTSLFDQTAETRARNKTVFWWVLNMSYHDGEKGKEEMVFPGGTYEEQLAEYDKLEDSEDEMSQELIQRLVYYISFWYAGRVSSVEDFKALDEDAEEYGMQEVSGPNEETAEKENDEVEKEPEKEKPKEEESKKKPVKRRKKKEKVSLKKAKKEETPVERTPVGEASVEETPVERAPAEETPAEGAPEEQLKKDG